MKVLEIMLIHEIFDFRQNLNFASLKRILVSKRWSERNDLIISLFFIVKSVISSYSSTKTILADPYLFLEWIDSSYLEFHFNGSSNDFSGFMKVTKIIQNLGNFIVKNVKWNFICSKKHLSKIIRKFWFAESFTIIIHENRIKSTRLFPQYTFLGERNRPPWFD